MGRRAVVVRLIQAASQEECVSWCSARRVQRCAECVSRFSWESREELWEAKAMPGLVNSRGLKAPDLCKATAVTQITVPLAITCHLPRCELWALSCAACFRIPSPTKRSSATWVQSRQGLCFSQLMLPVQRISLKFYKQSEAKQSECPGRSKTFHTRLFALSTYVNKCQHVLNTFGFCVQTLQWIPSALSQHLLKLDGRSWSPRCVSRENRARYPCGRGSTCTQHQRSSCMLLLVVDPCPFTKKMQTPFGKQRDIMKIEAEHSWTMIGCPNVRA